MMRSCCLLLLCAALAAPATAQIHSPVRAKRGMVVSACPIATDVGVGILKQGGNAIDAAVAVGFALAVTYPAAGNIGGGGFMVIHDGEGEVALDYREMAPKRAHRDLYRRDGEIDRQLSIVGHLASGIPGSVAGMLEALEKHGGSMTRKQVLAPAIALARDGFVVSPALAASLRDSRRLLSRFPESRRVLLRGGKFFEAGERLVQPELAATLQRISDRGRDGFYAGKTAELITAEMKRGGGIMDVEDLKGYRVVAREPLVGSYRGHRVVSMPPPSSGGVALLQMLALLEPYPVGRLGAGSERGCHLLSEVMRLAFRDRARYLGDPDHAKIPVENLISPRYADLLRPGIGESATVSKAVRGYDAFTMEKEETTHYSVMDADGRAVACTTTINGGYGCGVMVTGAGFLLNNEMDDFASAPGTPNMFGLIQGEANAVGAGKRPLSSMTPTLLMRDGKVVMVIGSPGGPTIINTVLQCILNRVDHGMNIAQAIAAPRIHHQWLPDRLDHEPIGMNPDLRRALQARGHKLRRRANLGNAQGITRNPKNGVLSGASDVRGDGAARGW